MGHVCGSSMQKAEAGGLNGSRPPCANSRILSINQQQKALEAVGSIVTHSDTQRHTATQWHTATHSDIQWHKALRNCLLNQMVCFCFRAFNWGQILPRLQLRDRLDIFWFVLIEPSAPVLACLLWLMKMPSGSNYILSGHINLHLKRWLGRRYECIFPLKDKFGFSS